ncbi:MAG: TetR/AcrR family transcriptional regulator [Candidatus Marinimicrobia bacterium]|nr:TetR/AcrR family transcriptional regulator [Candidatus Neomarinimicrobiota bacterium]MCF7850260.1 TetR/AcrR family transcriptional regulator [Candidatus Neomarinimicrobiota bacterium]MCF7903843.1 TetR/AcrR family transcriptional regulator [Candidatus Neomarinimicrobiota bacterium]
MRVKDDIKRNAIIEATVSLVNEIGFAASSVSKIAKRADVSPATIYIYFKNKDDLLVSTYVDIKTCLANAIMEDFDSDTPIRDAVFLAGKKLYAYINKHPKLFYFTEQFANSPYTDLVDKDKIEAPFKPMYDRIQEGIDQKIIKDVPFELLFAHLYLPIFNLVNPRLHPNFKATPEIIDISMNMAWDAIKL